MIRFAHWSGETVRNIWFVIALMLILVIIGMGLLLVQTRDSADQLTVQAAQLERQAELSQQTREEILLIAEDVLELSKQIRQTNDILVECTTPSVPRDQHECFEAQVAAQAAQVGQINAIVIAANVCGGQFPGQDTRVVRRCVELILAQSKPGD